MKIYERIAQQAISELKSDYLIDFAIGKKCVAGESSDGIGVAYFSDDNYNTVNHGDIRELENKIKSTKISKLIENYYKSDDPILINFALAVINTVLNNKGDIDQSNFADKLDHKNTFGMVGYFKTVADEVKREKGINPIIFELKDIEGTHKPAEAKNLLPKCDVILITGATFANKTFHNYIPYIPKHADVYIHGPSVPLADVLSDSYNLGASIVHDKNKLFKMLRDGSGFNLMHDCFTRVVVSRRK